MTALASVVQTLRKAVTALQVSSFRSFSTLQRGSSIRDVFKPHFIAQTSPTCLIPTSHSVEQTRSYIARGVPKLRCKDCYFVTRRGVLFVECKAKKRHRQYQLTSKSTKFKDDLTKGKYWEFVYKDYRTDRYYKNATPWSKEDLVGDRLGKDL